MITRRDFLRKSGQVGLAAASAPFILHSLAEQALADVLPTSYKAVVLIEQYGGNDGNNMLIPLDANQYQLYSRARSALALDRGSIIPLQTTSGPEFGLHWAMPNVARLIANQQGLAIANVGPLRQPVTKQELLNNPSLAPAGLFNHASGRAQWESASTLSSPQNGWGGLVGDAIASQAGQLPPVLNAGFDTLFTVGRSVQGVAIQANNGIFTPLPVGLTQASMRVGQGDCQSPNQLIAATAQLRMASMQQQTLIQEAMMAGAGLRTSFSNTAFGNVMRTIAQVINGRNQVGSKRQIFFCQQGSYDSHTDQLHAQADNLIGLDTGIGNFFDALVEMGLENQVLVCTHSDFGRSLQANTTGGTDHGWGNHHLVLGGGIRGGQVLGTAPDLTIGGPSDWSGQGTWIPTTSVTQMTSAIASWMGLTMIQINSIFPDLANFPAGSLNFV